MSKFITTMHEYYIEKAEQLEQEIEKLEKMKCYASAEITPQIEERIKLLRIQTMREILFRGKDKFDSEWYVGSLSHDTKYGNCFIEVSVHQGIAEEVIPETVGQYTGLKDKNGNEIFEGDILEGDLEDNLDPGAKWRSVVIWGKFGWMCKGRQTLPMDECDIREGEVVGNIHDNPELLKGSAKNE